LSHLLIENIILICVHFRVIELLLKNDARPGIRDNDGFNTVHYAALKGHKLSLEMVSIYSKIKQQFIYSWSPCMTTCNFRIGNNEGKFYFYKGVMNDEQCGKEIGLRNGNNIAQM
jgi:hypothetical protein